MRRFFTAVVAAFVTLQAWGQAYPNRPVRVVVAVATGGPDIVARRFFLDELKAYGEMARAAGVKPE